MTFIKRDLRANASWRLSFSLLSAPGQRARVRQLIKQGWSEESVIELTRWSRQDVLRAVTEPTPPRTP